MSNDLVSLDDIIKKKKKTNNTMRTKPANKPAVKNGPKANGSAPKRLKTNKPVEDARFKIIQKKRKFITDARDKLAQIAKQSDARLKLQKLRANAKKGDASISRKTGRSGRISLSTNKPAPIHVAHTLPPSFIPTSARSLGYRPPPMPEPHYVNELMMTYNNAKYSKAKEYDYLQQYHPKDYLLDHQAALRRTVSNDYAPSLPPPPPLFNIKPVSSYNWDKLPQSSSLSRSQTIRTVDQSRPRDYKVIPRTAMTKSNSSASYRDDWSFNSKTRTIIPDIDTKYYSLKMHPRDLGVKSRLDSPPLKSSRIIASSSRPKTSTQAPGYRIIVSNLQPNVTQEDIKELFEDVGELLISRLVRPGVAEVIYKTLKDATKAVDTYHNRQLDGHPMKCLLVNRSKTSSSASSGRILSQSRGASYGQPSLGTVHRALFD